jgi:hypothetical protein
MLWDNAGLLKKHGYYLPRLGLEGLQHARFSRHLIEMKRAMKGRRELRGSNWEELSSPASILRRRALEAETLHAETCLMSSEGFQNADPYLMAQLYPPDKTRIVIYFREQLSYLLSSYAQSVQGIRQTIETLDEYFEMFNFGYLDQVKKWVKVYGKDSVVMRVYERERFPGRDVRLDFLDILGITDHEELLLAASDPNPSISGTLLEFKRVLNKVSVLPASELIRIMYPITFQLALSYPQFRGGICVDEVFSERVRDKYRHMNTVMFNEFFSGIRSFKERSFTSAGLPVGYVDAKDLDIIWTYIKQHAPALYELSYDDVMQQIG